MHWVDLEFQIMPGWTSDGVIIVGLCVDAVCLLFMGGALAKVFLWSLNGTSAIRLKDPRMAEALEVYVPRGDTISTQLGSAK